MTELYPAWREASKRIAEHGEGWFVSDDTLSAWLRISKEHRDFSLGLMRVSESLLSVYGICLTRAENKDGVRGYRIANDSEKVRLHVERQQKRMHAAVVRQERILATVNTERLSEDDARKYDHQVLRSGFMRAFMAKLGRKKLHSGMRPELTDGDDD